MSEDIDIYRIARLLIEEHGVFASDEVKDKISYYTEAEDFNAIKTWYEIEDALKEIQESGNCEKPKKEKEEVLS